MMRRVKTKCLLEAKAPKRLEQKKKKKKKRRGMKREVEKDGGSR